MKVFLIAVILLLAGCGDNGVRYIRYECDTFSTLWIKVGGFHGIEGGVLFWKHRGIEHVRKLRDGEECKIKYVIIEKQKENKNGYRY